MSPLVEKIRARIRSGGPLPFRDFMAMALYDAQHGYYASGRAEIGRRGDFFTNVSVGPLFGRLLAMQFEEMWERLGNPQEFCIVEQGANNGDFARDVLQAVSPEFRDALRYVIVEPALLLRERQRATLADFSCSVIWHESLAELSPFCGVHFSNELLDAMPVHLVRFSRGEWRERCVDENLAFVDCEIRDKTLRTRCTHIPWIENYETEIHLDALAWVDEIAAKLSRGYLLAIDYGWPRDVFYSVERAHGTLTCYAQHQRSYDPLQNIGELDITAHVDFTSIAERAIGHGFELAGFTDQHHFIVGLMQHFFAQRSPDAKESRALQTLMHPQLLGTIFKVLALRKDAPALLRGFEFSRDAALALGLKQHR